jgi:hypothetical protein
MPTNKDILNRGFKYAVWALPMFFIGPTVINSSFKNRDHSLFIPVLGIGIIICVLAVVLLFRALKTILKSQSDE